jgi:hypothetical protein
MSSFRDLIAEHLKKNRPNLSDSSLKTYVSILFNLHKKLNPEGEDIKFFDDNEKILEHLKEKTPSTRKTVLSALFVLTGKKEYNDLMLQDCRESNEHYKEQKKSKKQEEGWMSMDEIRKIYDELLTTVNAMFSKKLLANYQSIINFILLGCLGAGVSGLPPRRSLDYTEMKIKNYNPQTDNYFKNGIFYFNIYKTQKTYGQQTLDVKSLAPEFYKILKKWVSCNPTDYLLFSSVEKKLEPSQITRMMNNVLGKTISVDLLRHIYLTEKYGKIQAEMKSDSSAMGHSTEEQALYIKK